jgi:hypothetical protein
MDGGVEAVEIGECLMGEIARVEVAPCADPRVPEIPYDEPTVAASKGKEARKLSPGLPGVNEVL